MMYSIITLTFIVRIFDGIEHGLHWNSKPSKNNGKLFHTMDLFQTWASRLIYVMGSVFLFGMSLQSLFFIIGLLFIDQSVWQMCLNKFASGGFFQGERDTAKFFFWFDSPKLFANHMRAFQFIIGLWFFIVSFFV